MKTKSKIKRYYVNLYKTKIPNKVTVGYSLTNKREAEKIGKRNPNYIRTITSYETIYS
jgi:thiamine monophosphate synthase